MRCGVGRIQKIETVTRFLSVKVRYFRNSLTLKPVLRLGNGLRRSQRKFSRKNCIKNRKPGTPERARKQEAGSRWRKRRNQGIARYLRKLAPQKKRNVVPINSLCSGLFSISGVLAVCCRQRGR